MNENANPNKKLNLMNKRPTSQKHLDKKMRLALEALFINKEEFAKRNHEYCEAYRKW